MKRKKARLPDFEQVLRAPKSALIPLNPIDQIELCALLADRISAANFGRLLIYLQRLPFLVRVFTIQSAFRLESQRRKERKLSADYKFIASSRDFARWANGPEASAVFSAIGGNN